MTRKWIWALFAIVFVTTTLLSSAAFFVANERDVSRPVASM